MIWCDVGLVNFFNKKKYINILNDFFKKYYCDNTLDNIFLNIKILIYLIDLVNLLNLLSEL
jgi:hypothetical protein